jgi:ribosomal protein S18 acetylase RimI-like enzyme
MVPMPEIVIHLAVRDLEPGDLLSCTWAGRATHLAAIARALERVQLGEVEYLAACPPSGLPMGLGAIDYAKTPGAGTIWMLEVHPALQSCGIGTLLIQAAEHRIRLRGLQRNTTDLSRLGSRNAATWCFVLVWRRGGTPDRR